jgi:DNA repair exonuclease SbcCD nuclease subunit
MTKLLAVGDIHLGRSPAALHPDLSHRQAELGPEEAWKRCVDLAIERDVDAVLLAGDVVERSRDLLVAFGDLKNGVERLADASIPVLAVAGNHDTVVLPRLAAEIESLELLGAGGKWQERPVGRLRILGWSFPRPHVRQSPLESLPKIDQPGQVVGLLHCDRDQADSPYAPVSGQALKASGLGGWLLGHIHQPDPLEGHHPIGYLGSATALRASDIGPRGPWLIEWQRQRLKASHLPIAPLRFDALELDLSDLQSPDELGEAALAASRQHLRSIGSASFLPDVIGLRLTFTGRCKFDAALAGKAEELIATSRPWREGPVEVFLQKAVVATEPAVDLDRLARQEDPCGLLARRILVLRDPHHPDHETLVESARPALAAVAGQKEFRHLDPPLDHQQLRQWLLNAARIALNSMLEQKRGST